MSKDIRHHWEQDGDLERLQLFFKNLDPTDEEKERIKRRVLQNIQQKDYNGESLNSDGFITPVENNMKKRKGLSNIFKGLKDTLTGRSWRYSLSIGLILFIMFIGKMGMDGGIDISFQNKNHGFESQPIAQDVAKSEVSPDIDTNTLMKEMDGNIQDFSMTDRSLLPQPQQSPPTDENLPRKITYHVYAVVQVEDVNRAIDRINQELKSYDGYIVESSLNEYPNDSSGYVILKVPSHKLDEFKGNLSALGKVIHQNTSANDITNQYYDIEARLRSLVAQEERYLEILKTAKTVEDILNIEKSLSNIRLQIESLQGQLKLMSHEVDYSRIEISLQTNPSTINIADPWQPVSWGSTMVAFKNALIKTISSTWNAFNYFVVGIAYALPYILMIGLVFAIYKVIRKIRK